MFSPLHPHLRFSLLNVLQPCLPGSSLSSGFSLLFTSFEGVPEGEPHVPVVLLALGNQEPLHSHCVSVHWKDQSLCACVVTQPV